MLKLSASMTASDLQFWQNFTRQVGQEPNRCGPGTTRRTSAKRVSVFLAIITLNIHSYDRAYFSLFTMHALLASFRIFIITFTIKFRSLQEAQYLKEEGYWSFTFNRCTVL